VANEPIDVRHILSGRAGAAGVSGERISVSGHCTRCTDSGLYSHRAGHAQRQVGFIGIRAADPS
jgi:copper oxidase (laccase) domain-containing protein